MALGAMVHLDYHQANHRAHLAHLVHLASHQMATVRVAFHSLAFHQVHEDLLDTVHLDLQDRDHRVPHHLTVLAIHRDHLQIKSDG